MASFTNDFLPDIFSCCCGFSVFLNIQTKKKKKKKKLELAGKMAPIVDLFAIRSSKGRRYHAWKRLRGIRDLV